MGYRPPDGLALRAGVFRKGVCGSGRLNTSRCSSGVEHFLGKEEVVSSILINGSDKLGFIYSVED
jgi:hypothetical protein